MIYSAIITNGKIKCGTAVFDEAPAVSIPKAAEMGFNGLQLTIGARKDYNVPELKKLCEEYGMKVTALATGRVYTEYGFSMGSGDEENRGDSVAALCNLADLCAELGGAALIIGACRGKTSDAPSPEIYHRQFAESLKEVCRYCAPIGVPVYFELIDYLESDCCNKLPEMLSYLKKTGAPNLFMYLDTMHLYYEKEDICAVFTEYGAKVPQVDISGEKRLFPTESAIDFTGALSALKASGFDGILTFEIDAAGKPEKLAENLAFVRGLMEG